MSNIKNNKMKVFYKILIGLIIGILLVVVIAGICGYMYLHSKLSKIDYVDLPVDEIEVNAGIEENLEEYRTIALFGLDARTDTLSDSRSDCIILVTINNITKDVKLTSVYRDTYLELDGRGLDKVTHAYYYGNSKLAINTLNKNLDLNIKEFVTVNFETVKTVVDSIGGVTVTITSAEATSIPNISTAGTYNLNGEQALAYARIRKIDSDYKRTERMRTGLTAVFEKVKTKSVSELNSLADIILPHVSTNISQSEIFSFIPQVFSYNVTSSIGWPYEVRAYTTPTWYGAPVTLESNVKKLHQEVFGEENYEVSDTVKEISNKIITKTGYSN